MLRMINIYEAKTHFSKLIEATAKGEEYIIAKAGKPVAKLSPMMAEKPLRRPGILEGKITIAEDFDASLPEDVLKGFEGH